MKDNLNLFNPRPKFEVSATRKEVARQLRDSEVAAQEVATLCALAVKTARLHKIPHAGVGAREHSYA